MRELNRNLGRTEIAGEVERLSAFYQPIPQVVGIVQMTEQARCVALIGDTGSGKSVLAAPGIATDINY
jgi:ABC-type branched-subunit amino acid transport system ATPase component